MKQLYIPTLTGLGELSMDHCARILEESAARASIESVNWPDRFPYRPLTSVYIAYSDAALHVLFRVHGNSLRACHTTDLSPVHEDSCVEFFVKLPESETYYNFEFNCIGTCKAARHQGCQEQATDFSLSELKTIHRWSSLGHRAFKELTGLFTWDLCVRIPLSLLEVDPDNLPCKLMGNFYKCADKTDQPHYVSWSPVRTEKPDFHQPAYFGELLLCPNQIG